MSYANTEKIGYRPGSLMEIIAMSLPMVISNACETVMVFTDRLFLSKVSSEAMNAAFGAGMTYFLMTTFFVGLIGYSTALVAQYYGAKRPAFCSKTLTQAIILAIIAVPIILSLRPLIHFYFNSVGLSETQLPLQIQYFNVVSFAVVFSLSRSAFAGFFTGIGRTKIVMVATLTSMVVNVGANYVLIFGKFGFPAMGVTGAALGTIIGLACALVIFIVVYLQKENRLTYQISQSIKFVPQIMKRLLRFGSPTGAEFFLAIIGNNAAVMVFHSQGDIIATATTIMFNWDLVAFLPLIGLEISVMSLVGRYMGAQNPDLAKKSAYNGLMLGLIYCGVMMVAFLGFPHYLVSLFANAENAAIFDVAAPIAVNMLQIASIYLLASAVAIVFTGALRGAGDTLWPMGASIAMNWTAFVATFVLMIIVQASAQWTWLGYAMVYGIFSLFYYWRFSQNKWRTIKVI